MKAVVYAGCLFGHHGACSQGLRQAFRRQIVHHLAREPSTFTSLNINLYEVDEQTLGTLLTQHLSEVADYAPASVHSEGRCVSWGCIHKQINK